MKHCDDIRAGVPTKMRPASWITKGVERAKKGYEKNKWHSGAFQLANTI